MGAHRRGGEKMALMGGLGSTNKMEMRRLRKMEMQRQALSNGRFNIERYDPKWMNIVVSLPAEDQRRT